METQTPKTRLQSIKEAVTDPKAYEEAREFTATIPERTITGVRAAASSAVGILAGAGDLAAGAGKAVLKPFRRKIRLEDLSVEDKRAIVAELQAEGQE